jgi:putative ABC transport system permease protein
MKALLSLRFAYRHFRASFWAMALSMIAVALGVALVVAIRLMNSTVLQGFLDTVDATAGRASLMVGGDEGAFFSDEIVSKISAVPGVKLAVPLVRGVAFPNDDSGELLTVHGVDLANDDAVRVYHVRRGSETLVEDLVEFLNQPDSVLLGRQFADARGLGVGDSLQLVTPVGVRPFTVRGLLDPQGTARVLKGRLVVMDVYAAQPIFTGSGQINQIDVLTVADVDIDAVRGTIATMLPSGIRVEQPEVRKQVLRRAVAAFQTMLSAFSLLATMAGFVVCFGRLQGLFETRTWEIGLLRAVGLRRLSVFSELLKEALLLGTGGVLVGIPLGIAIARWSLPILAQTTALNFGLPVPAIAEPPIGDAPLVGAAVGLLAALAAAVAPATRLARKSPVAALSLRGRESPAGPSIGRFALLGLAAVILSLIAAQGVLRLPVLGLATTALMVVGAAALSGPMIRGTVTWLRARSTRLDPIGRLVVAQLERAPRGTALTVTTLGIGLGTVIMIGTLGWSFEKSIVSVLTDRYSASLVITSAFVRGGYESAPVTDGVLREVVQVPGVSAVAGEQHRRISYQGSSVVLAAFDSACFDSSVVCDWALSRPVEGALRLVAEGKAILVSPSFSLQFGAREGDTIRLSSSSGDVELLIAAITPGQPESAIVLARHVYARHWDDSLVTWVHVATREGVAPGEVAQRIREGLGRKYRLRVLTSAEMIEHFAGQVREAFSLQYVLEVVTLFVVLVGVGDTLAAAVVARRRQFGMMRAVGLHRARLFGMVMLEGLSIGFLGLLLAVGLGLALSTFWVQVQFPALLGWTLEQYFPWPFFIVGGAVTMVVCMIGSLIPSVRAASLSPVAVLRGE